MAKKKQPLHQQIIRWSVYFILGAMALAQVLGTLSDAFAFTTPRITVIGSILVLVFWAGLEVFFRIRPVQWMSTDGQLVRLTALGIQYRLGFAGMLLILWVPRWLGSQPFGDRAFITEIDLVEDADDFHKDVIIPVVNPTDRLVTVTRIKIAYFLEPGYECSDGPMAVTDYTIADSLTMSTLEGYTGYLTRHSEEPSTLSPIRTARVYVDGFYDHDCEAFMSGLEFGTTELIPPDNGVIIRVGVPKLLYALESDRSFKNRLHLLNTSWATNPFWSRHSSNQKYFERRVIEDSLHLFVRDEPPWNWGGIRTMRVVLELNTGQELIATKVLWKSGTDETTAWSGTKSSEPALSLFSLETYMDISDDNFRLRFLTEYGENVNQRDSLGRSPLHFILQENRDGYDVINLLIKAGANVNQRDTLGRSPLFYAKRKRGAEQLIQAGAEVMMKDDIGQTPLHLAARNGYVRVAALLINNGVSMGPDYNGNRPLHEIAASSRSREREVLAEILIVNGADINAKNANGNTPLHVAMEHAVSTFYRGRFGYRNPVAELFCFYGADATIVNKAGLTPRAVVLESTKSHRQSDLFILPSCLAN